MTCDAEIRKCYTTLEEAVRYLSSRGFVYTPGGWENGRWSAMLEYEHGLYRINIRLDLLAAA